MHSLLEDIETTLSKFGCDPSDINYVRYRDATTDWYFDDSKNTYCFCSYDEFKQVAEGLVNELSPDVRITIVGSSWWMESDPARTWSWKFRRMPFKPTAYKTPSKEDIVASNILCINSNIE